MRPLVYCQPSFRGLIGVAREDITPPVGIYARNWGAAEHDAAEGIHRPLTVTTLSFRSESGGLLILISLDLGWWRNLEDEWTVRGAVLEALGLDEAHVMIHLTHTHSGPSICAEDFDKPGGSMIHPYLRALKDTVLKCAQSSLHNAQPAILTWRYGKCGLAANRDLPDPNQPRILSGFSPGNDADDTLLVGRITAESGDVLGTIVNYACHPTTLAWQNRLISPDYVGAMREVVESASSGAPCLFLLGAAGELGPREQYTQDVSLADSHGQVLGYAALSALRGMAPPGTRLEFDSVTESGAPLAVWKSMPDTELPATLKAAKLDVAISLKPWPSVVELEREMASCVDRALKERLARKARVRRIVGDGAETLRSVWIWQLGDSVILGHANEAYSLLQTTLRTELTGKAVAVANLVNGACGYMPTDPMYDFDAYPVWQTPFARGSLERMIKESVRGVKELTEWSQ